MKYERKILMDFGIPLFILMATTLLFWILPLDLKLQQNFYQAESGWFLGNAEPWNFLYNHSNLPALLISSGSLILLGISFFCKALIRFRKIFLYLVLIMAIGPGLLINSILKDNWGRPRPRNIEEFGGNYRYEKPLEIDLSSRGKSFPCGHASMGFYLMSLFLLLRKHKKLWAIFFFAGGFVLGVLIGIARIVQGGHFASDVIWAGGLVYLVAAGFFYLLKLDKTLYFHSKKEPASKLKVALISIIGLAVVALILLILSATPYSLEKKFKIEDLSNFAYFKINVPRADVEFVRSPENEIILEATGHGFPWSKLKTKMQQNNDVLILNQRESGFFSEIVQHITIGILSDPRTTIQVEIEEGNIIIEKNLEIDLEANLENGKILRK